MTNVTAYEKYLVNLSYKMAEADSQCNDHEENITDMLIMDCKEQNPQAFDLVEKVGHDGYTRETFKIAARMVIKRVFEK
jgi:hypothetical protein